MLTLTFSKLLLSGKPLKKLGMDSIKDKTNPLVHGRKKINAKEAKETFRGTISLIQDLYKLHKREA